MARRRHAHQPACRQRSARHGRGWRWRSGIRASGIPARLRPAAHGCGHRGVGGCAPLGGAGDRLWPGPELFRHLARLATRPAAARPPALQRRRGLPAARAGRSDPQRRALPRTGAAGRRAGGAVARPAARRAPPAAGGRARAAHAVHRPGAAGAGRAVGRARCDLPRRRGPHAAGAQPRHGKPAHAQGRGTAGAARRPRATCRPAPEPLQPTADAPKPNWRACAASTTFAPAPTACAPGTCTG